jgi:spermidine synthase
MNCETRMERPHRSNRPATKWKAAALLSALLGAGTPCLGSADPRSPVTDFVHERDSIYNHITVEQEGLKRCMLFGRRNQQKQTCIDVAEPTRPLLEYPSMMCVGFLFVEKPRRAALLGLGGGYLPLLFRAFYPSVSLDVVEIDKVVVELAEKFFFFETSSQIACEVRDGRQFLKRTRHTYDQIWIDAFNGDYIPAHMTTLEFLRLAKSKLSERGVVIQNVHNSNALYDAQVATFRAVFRTVHVFTGVRSANAVILASDAPLKDPAVLLQELVRESRNPKIGDIDLVTELRKYEPSPKVREAKVLTDDYSPANLLLHRR